MTDEHLASLIRSARMEKGLTQRRLAELVGVTMQSVSDWEIVKRRPSESSVRKLAIALETDVEVWLLARKGSSFRLTPEIRPTNRKAAWADDAQLALAVASSRTFYEVSKKVGIKHPGQSMMLMKQRVLKLGMDISHFEWYPGTGEHNRVKTHCPKGHPYNEANTYWKGNRRVCRECHRQAALAFKYRNLELVRKRDRENARRRRAA